jgi:DNA-directed RNA polymerase specialized sigma24 family protein
LRLLEHQDAPVLAWLYAVARRRLVDQARAGARAQGTLASLDDSRARPIEATLEYGEQLGNDPPRPRGRRHQRDRVGRPFLAFGAALVLGGWLLVRSITPRRA